MNRRDVCFGGAPCRHFTWRGWHICLTRFSDVYQIEAYRLIPGERHSRAWGFEQKIANELPPLFVASWIMEALRREDRRIAKASPQPSHQIDALNYVADAMKMPSFVREAIGNEPDTIVATDPAHPEGMVTMRVGTSTREKIDAEVHLRTAAGAAVAFALAEASESMGGTGDALIRALRAKGYDVVRIPDDSR